MRGCLLTAAVGAAAVAALIAAAPAATDFATAVEAYDAGDYRTAAEIWRELAEQGHPEALLGLAGLYRFGAGVPQDLERAARLYERAAERGNADAQRILGDLYARGLGVPRSTVVAYTWLIVAAARGSAWAEHRRRELATAMTPEQIDRAETRAETLRSR